MLHVFVVVVRVQTSSCPKLSNSIRTILLKKKIRCNPGFNALPFELQLFSSKEGQLKERYFTTTPRNTENY